MVNLYQPNSSAPFASAGTYDLFSLPSLSNVSGGTIATAFSINAATDNAAFSYVFGTSGNDITVTLTQSSVAATWALNGNGVWDTGVPGNWIGGVPNLAGSTATFGTDGGTITVSPLVTLDQNQSVGGMSFTAPQSYTIQSSGGVLTLDNKGNGAAIAVSAGTANLITAPVLLNDNLTVNIGSGDSLSISGNHREFRWSPDDHSCWKRNSGLVRFQYLWSFGGHRWYHGAREPASCRSAATLLLAQATWPSPAAEPFNLEPPD